MRRLLVLGTLCLIALSSKAQIWLEYTRIDTQEVVSDLTVPWDMQWFSEDTIVFTELAGWIKRVDVASGHVDTLYEVTEAAVEAQAGLMGLQLHPDWPSNNNAYVAYTYYDGSNIKLKIAELSYNTTLQAFEFSQDVVSGLNSGNSNTGCRLLIGSDEKLYVTLGDVKDSDKAQDESSVNGKVLRYNLDGSIPSDNPITGSPVFTLGHRNPQGLIETSEGKFIISEHGPFTDDELNLLEAGANYGWPLVSGPCSPDNQSLCDSIDMVEPMADWTPTVAPAGIEFYDNPAIPEWSPSILMACMKVERVMALKLNANHDEVTYERSFYIEQFGRIRDVLAAPNGDVYISTTNRDQYGEPTSRDDRIIRLIPSEHNTIEQVEGQKVKVVYHEDKLLISQPYSGQVTVTDILGRTLFSETMQSTQEISLPADNSTQIIFVSLWSADARTTVKIIRH